MSLYIVDKKKGTVKHYCTSAKVNKAIEHLLEEMDDMIGSETLPGYTVRIVEDTLQHEKVK